MCLQFTKLLLHFNALLLSALHLHTIGHIAMADQKNKYQKSIGCQSFESLNAHQIKNESIHVKIAEILLFYEGRTTSPTKGLGDITELVQDQGPQKHFVLH